MFTFEQEYHPVVREVDCDLTLVHAAIHRGDVTEEGQHGLQRTERFNAFI